jgi:hypothetical protein
MRGVTSGDLLHLVEDLDERVRAEELSWKTANNAWGIATKMFKDAVTSKTGRWPRGGERRGRIHYDGARGRRRRWTGPARATCHSRAPS